MGADEFQVPEVMHFVSYREDTFNHIRNNLPIKLHRSRRLSLLLFSKYTLDSSGSGLRGGPQDHQNRPSFSSEFLHTGYLHIP